MTGHDEWRCYDGMEVTQGRDSDSVPASPSETRKLEQLL